MANIKFSAFTNEAVDAATTELVGYKVGDATANYRYTIPQKGDKSGGGSPIPPRFDILAEIGFPTELQTEDGLYIMEQEIAPHKK